MDRLVTLIRHLSFITKKKKQIYFIAIYKQFLPLNYNFARKLYFYGQILGGEAWESLTIFHGVRTCIVIQPCAMCD